MLTFAAIFHLPLLFIDSPSSSISTGPASDLKALQTRHFGGFDLSEAVRARCHPLEPGWNAVLVRESSTEFSKLQPLGPEALLYRRVILTHCSPSATIGKE